MSVSPEVLKKIKKVAFYKYEPNVQDVLWAKPVGDGVYQFLVYYNGTWNSIADGEDGITINISPSTYQMLQETSVHSTMMQDLSQVKI